MIKNKLFAASVSTFGLLLFPSTMTLADDVRVVTTSGYAASPAPGATIVQGAPAPVTTVQPTPSVVIHTDPNQGEAVVSWRDIKGTVQGVDRYNKLITVQDSEGKNLNVIVNDHVHFFENGREVLYPDVNVNDQVVLKYYA